MTAGFFRLLRLKKKVVLLNHYYTYTVKVTCFEFFFQFANRKLAVIRASEYIWILIAEFVTIDVCMYFLDTASW